MDLKAHLDQLVRAVDGAQGAVLLDATGELVVEAGPPDDRQRLIGAYQGIGLSQAQKLAEQYRLGGIDYVLCRYRRGQVILRPLKDGYYLVLSLQPDANLALGLHRSRLSREHMNEEI
jgi:predicted regulator of Ras-like GTPase activity (Roadblock/LC7/MglB family)